MQELTKTTEAVNEVLDDLNLEKPCTEVMDLATEATGGSGGLLFAAGAAVVGTIWGATKLIKRHKAKKEAENDDDEVVKYSKDNFGKKKKKAKETKTKKVEVDEEDEIIDEEDE